ncbi:hypothetical protein DXG03_000388 [Asterophora parasitica]|uniref:Uncharacterized protein n=1 Tax=Asterophora parasitica TaxID=117018 RepID=A0A9P7GG66_9AGAR|nr:hypothetical protein DXG03_000388 [Asterophora parasitica]
MLDYSRLGLGFPRTSSYTDAAQELDITDSQTQEMENRGSVNGENGDSSVLMGIMQELVEETNQWDGSLFKDQNFKSMIEQSAKHPGFKGNLTHGRVVKEPARRPDGLPEDESQEFDLSLLGLDIFRSGGETFIPGTQDKRQLRDDNDGTESLVSFWEGSRDWSQDAKRSVLGQRLFFVKLF